MKLYSSFGRSIASALLVCCFTISALAEEREAPPIFMGDDMPVPPQQNMPWTPPAEPFPEKLLTATVKLFEQGLADPRGCEYREIEVVAGSVWGGAAVIKTHG